MTGKDTLRYLNSPGGEALFAPLYGPSAAARERQRYAVLADGVAAGNPRLFSAPGRTELGGNHTDHNRGRVLAAAIQMDAAAAVVPRGDRTVFFRSTGFPDVLVSLDGPDGKPDLSPKPEERGKTESLVRGIASGFADRGVEVGGFSANASSTVLPGSGLSSSAAVEVLIAKIFDCLYGGGRCSAVELARICQQAENAFFGKPCGLMDQAASACGGAVAIDLADPSSPQVRRIGFDPKAAGYALCVVNTRGSHSDLTPDYAAIPQEMGDVARFFGKSFLNEIDLPQLLSAAPEVRKIAGDRALLRAIHFFNENGRADAMAALIEELAAAAEPQKWGIMGRFLDIVNESGDSSWELLQNMYSARNPREQGLSLALAASREFFREHGLRAACRVHGGGFAGTAQAYVPAEALEGYRSRMDALFGPGSLAELCIRPVGAVEIAPC
ncbi:MAG: galactokinase [Treponema sp.]|nr:galactokinase [Treponema sp.]